MQKNTNPSKWFVRLCKRLKSQMNRKYVTKGMSTQKAIRVEYVNVKHWVTNMFRCYTATMHIWIFFRYILIHDLWYVCDQNAALCSQQFQLSLNNFEHNNCTNKRLAFCLHIRLSVYAFNSQFVVAVALIAIQVWLIKRVLNVCWHFFRFFFLPDDYIYFWQYLQTFCNRTRSTFFLYSCILLMNCWWTLVF